MNNKTTLAIFDFDGTLTRGDSFYFFLKIIRGKGFFVLSFLLQLPNLLLYKTKLRTAQNAKQSVINKFLKGQPISSISEKIEAHTPHLNYNPKAIDKLLWHQNKGHHVVVVSASPTCFLEAFCQQYHVDLIATDLETNKGVFTGKLSSKNCNGIEKLNRLKKHYRLADFNIIYAYGDTKGDLYMLNQAHYAFFRVF